MEFTLFYRGDLKSNGNPTHKHELRRKFHNQLDILWKSTHLDRRKKDLIEGIDAAPTLLRQHGDFNFVPLVAAQTNAVAEINMDVLWSQSKGKIITHGGDIDNRLKTLLDALKVPSEPTSLPKSVKPEAGEDPFFCLLEDDSLITKLSVQTDQLLENGTTNSEVVVLLRVNAYHLFNSFGKYL